MPEFRRCERCRVCSTFLGVNGNRGDYILGTNEAELARLALQHRIWQPYTLDCWRRAGIKAGGHVLDVGAGPGCAALDLADMVGPGGIVTAVERSANFVRALNHTIRARSLSNLEVHEIDLMKDELPQRTYDSSWCRWVAMFLPDPTLLIRKLAGALRPQGIAMFHEYAQYNTWRFCPALPLQEEFVRRALESWRATGAEPDIARDLPSLLIANGFQIRSVLPRLFCVGPDDPIWQWLATFIDSGLDRLLVLDLADGEFATELRRELAKRERDPASLVISPLILEIIAEKRV